MGKETKRRWKRWVTIGRGGREACLIAKRKGMQIISARKSNMSCFYCLGLYGSSKQLQATERAWTANGFGFEKRRLSHFWPVEVDLPREDWADPFIVEGCLPYLFHCECGATWRGFVPEDHPEMKNLLRREWHRVHSGEGHKLEYWTLDHEGREFAPGEPVKLDPAP